MTSRVIPRFRTLVLLACALLAMPARAAAQAVLEGAFHLLWGDPRERAGEARLLYTLTDDAGRTYYLEIDPGQAGGFQGLRALHGSRVSVRAARVPPAGAAFLRVNAIEPAASGPGRLVAGAPQSGAKPYITILCRFADATHVTPHDPPYYANWLTGTAYPNLDHYWREISEDRINLSGSRVVGWYNLPGSKASYGSDESPALDRMMDDCTRAADADVDFTQYVGVNMQFNLYMEYSWGGGGVLNVDGPSRIVPATWMANWADRATYAHEIGHSFGLPHSSGPYSTAYDSDWDVMSGGWGYDSSIGESLTVHTIAYHKDLLGWVPAARKYVAQPGSRQTITIERGARPPAGGGYLMAEIPINGGPAYAPYVYTVEARQFHGYDRFVPGEAIVIHRVQPIRDRPAQVVDIDSDGDPNDAAAMWLPGETFTDAVEGVTVRVESRSATGWVVTIDRADVIQLTVNLSGTGTVTGDGGFGAECSAMTATSCTRTLPVNSTVNLTATPLFDYDFLGWEGDCSGTDGCTLQMDRDRSVTANFGNGITITSPSTLPRGITGRLYQRTLTASGGMGERAWTVTAGSLPPGITLSTNGTVSGTPTAAGTFTFTVRVVSGAASASQVATLQVVPPVVIQTSALRGARQNVAYADTLRATGGTGSYSWSVMTGALPQGITLSSDGVLSGVSTVPGTASFAVEVVSGLDVAFRILQLVTDGVLVITSPDTLRTASLLNAHADTLWATGGTGTYTWSVAAGALPPGLVLAGSGVISGTPAQNGTFHFTARVVSDQAFAEKAFVLRALSFPQLVSDTTRPAAVRGRPYADTLRATGGLDGTFRWSVEGGALPSGLALDSATGVISGVPTGSGRYRFLVNAAVLFVASGATFNISVLDSLAITSGAARRGGVRSAAYADTLKAAGGTGAYAWAVTGGTLPPGLFLATTGVLTGSPTQVGLFSFTATVTSGPLSAAAAFTVAILEPLAIASAPQRPAAVLNLPYADTLRATGGTGSYAWSVAGGALPQGITLSSGTGVLSGTPVAAGTYSFTVTVQSGALGDTRVLSIAVVPPVTIVSDSVRRAGVMGAAYADTLRAGGGDEPAVWSLAGGTLPDGVSLGGTGVLSGIAERDGTFRFTARATAGPVSSTRQFVVSVSRPVLAAGAVVDQLLGAGSLTQEQARFLDLLGNRNGRVDVGDVRAWLTQAGQIDAALQPVLDALLRDGEPAGPRP